MKQFNPINRITTIINYSTNEYRFIEKCLEEASHFSFCTIVSVCDHFFDGTKEDRALLDATYAKFPNTKFLEFAWHVKQLYTPFHPIPKDETERLYLWHSAARYIGCYYLPKETEYLLFLDADEIVEGKRFFDWLSKGTYLHYDALWFSAYRYRFSAAERRKDYQYGPLMVRKSALEPLLVMNVKERFGHLSSIRGKRWLKGFIQKPFFHHYSWTRPLNECLQKATTWGRRTHKNWPKILKEAWEKNEFIEECLFDRIEPYFNPLEIELPKKALSCEGVHVERINPEQLFQRQLEALLAID